MQVNVSGGGKAVANSLTTMEIQGIAFGLTGMLANRSAGVNTCNRALRDFGIDFAVKA